MLDEDLADFAAPELTLEGNTRRVYVAGSGPALIVIAEMPGISPDVTRFARWVRDAGCTVHMPSLFGWDRAVPDADEGAEVFRRACVSAESSFTSKGVVYGVADPTVTGSSGARRVAVT